MLYVGKVVKAIAKDTHSFHDGELVTIVNIFKPDSDYIEYECKSCTRNLTQALIYDEINVN